MTARTTVAAQYARVGRAPHWNDNGMVHGQAAADWVEVFTEVVLADEEDLNWLAVVLLDSTSFWRRQGGRQVPAFHVLMAYGYDVTLQPAPTVVQPPADDFEDLWSGPAPVPPPQHTRGRLLRAEVHVRSDTFSWTAFLGGLAGMPQVVVADRAQEIRAALRATWPAGPGLTRPEYVNCRWHMAQNLREALAEDIVALNLGPGPAPAKRKAAESHPLMVDAATVFDSPAAFYAYSARCVEELDYAHLRLRGEDGKLSGARRWLKDNELLIVAQQERRPLRPGPESTGPLEAEISNVRDTLRRRAQVLRNQPRTNLLLRLVVAGRRGTANERNWAEKVRQYLARLNGIPQQQRRLVEARGHSSL